MKIHESKPNYTVVLFNKDGDDIYVLFSYKTAVAYNDSNGFVITDKKWSKTTTKHIMKFLNGARCSCVEQEHLDNLMNTIQV